MTIVAYDIRPNLDHIPKRPKQGEVATFDAILFPEGCIKTWDLINTETYSGPDPINFLGWVERRHCSSKRIFGFQNSYSTIISGWTY
jgi:hypothetical protein